MKSFLIALMLLSLAAARSLAAGYMVKQSSTAYPLVFFMTDSTDHVTGKTGLTCTVTLSKSGGSFASPSGAVTEIASGWYKVAGNATDTATLGPLILHATATGADATDAMFEVVAVNTQSATAFITGVNSLAPPTNWNLTSIDSNGRQDIIKLAGTTLTARDIGASVLVGDKTGFSLTQVFPSNFASLGINASGHVSRVTLADTLTANSDKTGYTLTVTPPTAATTATAVRTELTTELGRIDAAITTRLASGSYTAPPSAATVAAAVRTELTTELARIDVGVGTRLATAGYTAPSNAAIAAIQVVTDKLAAMIEASGGHDRYKATALEAAAGGGLTAQETRDAMKLAPTVGAAATNSIDAKIDKTYKAAVTK